MFSVGSENPQSEAGPLLMMAIDIGGTNTRIVFHKQVCLSPIVMSKKLILLFFQPAVFKPFPKRVQSATSVALLNILDGKRAPLSFKQR